MTDRDGLVRFLAAELDRTVSPGARALAAGVRERHGDAVRAVLFYGSCLRRRDDEGVLDLYVLVDDYRNAYERGWLVLLNNLLPPNVFFLETLLAGRSVRAKYAVVSLDAFARLNCASTFEPYFWARFAQPCALLYAADADAARRVAEALADAVITLLGEALPLAPPGPEVGELWRQALTESYRTELRAERAGAAAALFEVAAQRYAAVTELALPALPWPARLERAGGDARVEARIPDRDRRAALRRWWRRRILGKGLSVLRLLRNGLTFDGGLDYLAWKIERHSGVAVDSSWRAGRFRLASLAAEVLRLYRRGAFR